MKYGFLGFLLGLIVGGAGTYIGVTQYEMHQYYEGCPTVGRFDRVLATKPTSGEGVLVQGWVIAPEQGVALRLDDKATFALQANEDRRDVHAQFPDCKAAAASGFTLRMPLGTNAKKIALVANAEDGRPVVLEEQEYPQLEIRIDLDSQDDIDPDGRNVLSGWAVSSAGTPVRLEVIALGKTVATMDANLPRSDVAVVYPKANYAATSGFDTRIPFEQLPRGEYPLVLRATIPGIEGPVVEKAGPMVRNRYAYGVALTLRDRAKNPKSFKVIGWFAHESGIRGAQLMTAGGTILGPMTLLRADADFHQRADPSVENLTPPIATGSLWQAEQANTLGEGVHRLQMKVSSNDGGETIVPAQLIVNDRRDTGIHGGGCARQPLYVFYPTGPGTIAGLGEQLEVGTLRNLVEGPCVHVGMRLRVEYLRTTLGRTKDFEFDPYFRSSEVRVNGRAMTTAGLDEALSLSEARHMPVLISLDGGVWADSAFPAPDWDVVDNLENDESAVQWNQDNRSEKDDALNQMAGATNNPQLARMMSLNVYNERFRAYKKRNLQAAIAFIVEHQKQHPDHVVMVNFDSDNYINPWFKNTQWYDYNPKTVQQFREWLSGTGAYAAGGPLAGRGLLPSLDLAAINAVAGAKWKALAQIDPPRGPLDGKSPWYLLWIRFKRHLVAEHYSDLSRWACDAGMRADQVFTAVGIADGLVAKSFDAPIHSWNDQSGVSLQGGRPACGHLGVVMYGPATRGASRTPEGEPLMDLIRDTDPHFGVVEFHAANLDLPNRLPTEEESRRTMETLINAGAVFLSPMWGSVASSQGLFPGQFHAYEAMEGSTFETEIVRALRELNARGSRAASARTGRGNSSMPAG